jgi:TPR repeat protein
MTIGAAQAILGFCYEFGLGIKPCFEKAEHHYLLTTNMLTATSLECTGASDMQDLATDSLFSMMHQACLVAVARLAFLRKYGRPGVKMDRCEADYYEAMMVQQQQFLDTSALSWFRHAAQVYKCAASQYCLGVCYHDGLVVSKDENEAFLWYKKSADQGNCRGQGILGYCYGEGFGVDKDERMAITWYRRAAAQGETVAVYNIGYCFEEGIGVDKDIAEAVRWYTLAAQQGNAFAQNALGYCYEDGIGVIKDVGQAVVWYRHSADQGYPWAQCNLGYCHQNGIGVDKNPVKGAYW